MDLSLFPNLAVLSTDFVGAPVWMWLAFLTLVSLLMALDLGVLHRRSRAIGVGESLALSAFYIGLALAFGLFVWRSFGAEAAAAYLTAFAVEKALAMDNVFVIAMIFSALATPLALQHRVLFWGVVGVIALRALLIGAGAALIAQASWVLLVFAAVLILTGLKMLFAGESSKERKAHAAAAFLRRRMNVTPSYEGGRFLVKRPDATGRLRWFATPLLLALVLIETADVVFAVDSVPAIFAITTDPFIVYTSNIFAILGLRALYFALAAMIARFAYLKYALAAVLIFIGGKIFVADLFELTKIPPLLSLGVTLSLLTLGVLVSLWRTRRDSAPEAGG
ncbi:tellurite resistance protein TerC [Rhodoblastus acidophilus]|uniref:TerC/Alx family metal homeostasis membrane protein n=1 Tax=Rhodoblastus acidophilus TaxID=1074 RepID=UPI002223FD22|nr:TerC/Alx family metal homeostasis membrane protein [Rhodoblastus acidophilus]MCW2318727.1 tellurite resistance protein TerC [Rhodoblastus acidophilus]